MNRHSKEEEDIGKERGKRDPIFSAKKMRIPGTRPWVKRGERGLRQKERPQREEERERENRRTDVGHGTDGDKNGIL